MNPFLSYLVTCKNEGNQLQSLIDLLSYHRDDSECIILDDYSDDYHTMKILESVKSDKFFKVEQHHLNNHYGEHKTYGKSLCKGKWIFQIDADELPSKFLLDTLKDILKENDDIEMFWVPRINDFVGVTEEHARRWGWKLSDYQGRKIVNWPDYQSRIFQNKEHLKWERRLHEKIENAKVFSKFPESYDFSLIHNKTIEKQESTNVRYNKEFSVSDNKGF